jgi:hypothetical protein
MSKPKKVVKKIFPVINELISLFVYPIHLSVAQVLRFLETIIHAYNKDKRRLTPRNIRTKIPAILPIPPLNASSMNMLFRNIKEV